MPDAPRGIIIRSLCTTVTTSLTSSIACFTNHSAASGKAAVLPLAKVVVSMYLNFGERQLGTRI